MPPGGPKRIIAIAPNATEVIFALGSGDRLVGVSDFCELPPDRSDIPRVGGLIDPNLELILRLRPDLVIARGKMLELEKLCATNGIPVYHDPTERLDQIFQTIADLGTILEKSETAAALNEQIRSHIDRVQRALAGRARPRVLFTTDRPIDSLARVTTSGRRTFVDEMIRLAGGENIFRSLDVAYPEVSLEAILAAQPEVIIEVMPGFRNPPADLQQIVQRQWASLGPMPATRDGRVFVATDAQLVIPSTRIGAAVERLARLLHPEVSYE